MIESRNYLSVSPVLDKNGMLGGKLYSAPEGEVVHIRFEPGAHLPAHTTPVNVVFYVLEGSAAIQIGDESRVFEQDSLVESPMGIPHAITNEGVGVLRVLVIKMPKP